MKRLLMILFILSALGITVQAQNHTVTLKITNIKSNEGKVLVSIFDKEEGFLEEGKFIRNEFIDIEDNKVDYVFDNLSTGHYAIALYHDENLDGKCNRNWLGIPKEGYGFSKNFKPKLSAPSFDEVKIKVATDTVIEIKMIN